MHAAAHAQAGHVQDGWTPLMLAAYNSHAQCMELLLGKGAKMDQAKKASEGLHGAAAPTLLSCSKNQLRPVGNKIK